MNKRQWKFRVKNNRCWKCDIPLKPRLTHDAYYCPKCQQEYPSVVLSQYRQSLKPIFNP